MRVWATSVISCAVCVCVVCMCVCICALHLTHISFANWRLIRKTANLRLLHQLLTIERILNTQTHAQHGLENEREKGLDWENIRAIDAVIVCVQ